MVLTRRRRRVRVHLDNGSTFEGLQVGRRPAAGHYVLQLAKVLETPGEDAREVREITLDAQTLEIPAARVIALEVITS